MEESAVRRPESSAVGAWSGPGEEAVRRGEGALVKIRERLCAGGGARIHDVNRSDEIRHIGGRAARKGGIPHALVHLNGKARGKTRNTLDLPAFRQPSR